MSSEDMEIDDSLYSRQRYMLGDQAMTKMMSSKILLIGCDCLGIEIAKNLVLTGVGKLEISDSKPVKNEDVKTNIYVSESDVKNEQTRALSCVSHLKELNPYVDVSVSTFDQLIEKALQNDSDAIAIIKKSFTSIDCIVVSQCSLRHQIFLNNLCRDFRHPKFVSANVYGIFSSIFCDFGEGFIVYDTNGEQLKEGFVAQISNSAEGVVTCLENMKHGLESGDIVMFKDLNGMEELNDQVREIKFVSPYAFSIGDTQSLSKYESGGVFKQVRQSAIVTHQPLQSQLLNPNILLADFGKFENPLITHVSFMALNKFLEKMGRLPYAWYEEDAALLCKMYEESIKSLEQDGPEDIKNQNIPKILSFTARGCLSPLCAAVGGVVSQEALKSITGKYTPMNQWIYIDAMELVDNLNKKQSYEPNDVLSNMDICLGREFAEFLTSLKVFMVGCGAIGCEMLKNLALLGVSSGTSRGKMVITDNDTIEKSNLNRQFLFRSKHVGQSKSVIGCLVAKEICPHLNVEALQHKVGPDTEGTVFTDDFFKSNDIIVNALDNVEARRYMDARCVNNQLPMLESGTMGPKGHVQVIVPFITESYSRQSDPGDVQYLFCTLKSFPFKIEHTIQWARDKFEALFSQKPMLYNKFWEGCKSTVGGEVFQQPDVFAKYLQSGGSISDAYIVIKLLHTIPKDWIECVQHARRKFEVLFNHKAKNLLTAFPLDNKLENGTPFWSSPKRPPTPLVFDTSDKLHMQFITSFASLMASIYDIPIPDSDRLSDTLMIGVQTAEIPQFVASGKEIVVDEKAAPRRTEIAEDIDETMLLHKFEEIFQSGARIPSLMAPAHFEKDDDSNHHIDFISAAANLRATMYSIENVDRLEVKRIAGKIIPAISTTTSAIAGFATIQFLQLAIQIMNNQSLHKCNWPALPRNKVDNELSKYRNTFLNLALPVFLFSEPAAAPYTDVASKFSYSDWDRWDVKGHKEFKLNDLLQHFKSKVGLEISAVLIGTRMVYMSFMPGHAKKLQLPMTTLIKASSDKPYVNLTITFSNDSGDDDWSCPVVRYHF